MMLLFAHVLNPLLMVLIPLILGGWIVRRWKLDWAVFGIGALTFIFSQVLHIPFNQFVLNPALAPLGREGVGWLATSLALGLSAGVFEELARYLVIRRASERVQTWREGVLFGVGHGGAEAIILGGLVFYGLFQALALRGVALEGVLPAEQLEAARLQLDAYWGMAWYEPLWATLERLSAMAFHVLAALMVLLAVQKRQPAWLVGAIVAHTLFNAVALLAITSLGTAATELILAALGAGCIGVAFVLRRHIVTGPITPMVIEPASPGTLRREADERERLDGSRFL